MYLFSTQPVCLLDQSDRSAVRILWEALPEERRVACWPTPIFYGMLCCLDVISLMPEARQVEF